MTQRDVAAVTGGRIRTGVALAALLVLCVGLLVPVAHAGKPFRMLVPIGSGFTDAPGDACPAAIAPDGVQTELIGGNEAMTFFDDGRLLVTARHVDRVTNVATGTSVVLDLTGSIANVARDDGTSVIRASGTLGFVFFPGDAGPGDDSTGRFYVFTGTVRIETDEFGVFTGFESTGRMQDVCALIA